LDAERVISLRSPIYIFFRKPVNEGGAGCWLCAAAPVARIKAKNIAGINLLTMRSSLIGNIHLMATLTLSEYSDSVTR
jgi:hypothetical protein